MVICIGKGDQDGRVRPETLYRGNGQRLVGLIFKVNPLPCNHAAGKRNPRSRRVTTWRTVGGAASALVRHHMLGLDPLAPLQVV